MGPAMISKPSTSPAPPQQPSPAETLGVDTVSGGLGCFSLCRGWDVEWSQGTAVCDMLSSHSALSVVEGEKHHAEVCALLFLPGKQ